MAEYSNILIIKPGAIGDLLQLTPVIRALHDAFPGASVSLLVGNGMTSSLFDHNPFVQKTIVFDKKGAHRHLCAFSRLWRELRGDGYDLVINFQRSNLKAWLLVTATFPSKVLVYHKVKGKVVHAVQNHLETLTPLGIDPICADKDLELFVGDEAEAYVNDLFRSFGFSGKRIVALNPGASHPVNRWSPANFARLADRLAEELSVKVVIIGGREDVALSDELVGLASNKPENLTGKTTLLQLGAVLKRCRLLVSGDTGPMHMATAVNTPVAALFGAADPARTGPVGKGHRVIQAEGLHCVPCRSRRCSGSVHLECMESITVDKVFRTVASMLLDKED